MLAIDFINKLSTQYINKAAKALSEFWLSNMFKGISFNSGEPLHALLAGMTAKDKSDLVTLESVESFTNAIYKYMMNNIKTILVLHNVHNEYEINEARAIENLLEYFKILFSVDYGPGAELRSIVNDSDFKDKLDLFSPTTDFPWKTFTRCNFDSELNGKIILKAEGKCGYGAEIVDIFSMEYVFDLN